MPNDKLLIVDDDLDTLELLQLALEKEGYQCHIASKGVEALEILSRNTVDLLILDVMLPDMSGLEVCKKIKQDKKWTSLPIILLTGRTGDNDKVVGLELGAEDYIIKPYNYKEVSLRIQKILKRTNPQPAAEEILRSGELEVNIQRHAVTAGRSEVSLTPLEFKLLVTLMQKKGLVLSRDQLLENIWDISAEVTTRTIDVCIKRLREKLGNLRGHIETVRGFGYRFKEE
jgi:two-component system phosphate regulon response regulator PhoB